MIELKRMWFNQPSKLQAFHKLHNTNVPYSVKEERVWFLTGAVEAQLVPTNPIPLSENWK